MKNSSRIIIKYAVSALIGAVIVMSVFMSENLFMKTEKEDIFKILCDGFFVAGALMAMFGLLVFASAHGAFDGISFIFSQLFITHNWSFKKTFKDRETFAEYVQRKNGSRAKTPVFLIIVGVCYVAVSIVFLVIYYQYAA